LAGAATTAAASIQIPMTHKHVLLISFHLSEFYRFP
jgi:hypothetical protein